MKHYNQTTPPDYNLSALDFPIGIWSGDIDPLAPPKDVAWVVQQLDDKLVFHKQYHLAHEGFAIAKDMTWFTKDVMDVLGKISSNSIEAIDELKRAYQ